jgi:hypothetical protein
MKKLGEPERPLFEDLKDSAESLVKFNIALRKLKEYKSLKPTPHNKEQARGIVDHGPKYLRLFYAGIIGPTLGISKVKL